MREPLVDVVPKNAIISTSSKILEIDLCTMSPGEVEFSSEYSITLNHSEQVNGLVAWWDAEFFRLPRPVTLSTSPYSKATHWKQTIFYTSADMRCERGDVLHGSIANRKSLTNFRELDIKISCHVKSQSSDTKHCVNLYKLR
jgi:protein arginine N-methyltransferase 1